jgi:hypothetical protein
MDRRRSLLAASQKLSDNPWGDLPPESTEFGFPLYLNITEYDASYGSWVREYDEIGRSFTTWCGHNCVYDSFGGGYVPITEETKIYINGGLVDEILFDSGNYLLYGENLPFDEVSVDTGWLYGYGAKLPSSGGDLYLTLNTTNADNIKAFQLMESEKILAPMGDYYDWCPSNTNIFVSGEVEKATFTNACVKLADKPQYEDCWSLYFENMSEMGAVPVCYLYPNGLLEAYNDD